MGLGGTTRKLAALSAAATAVWTLAIAGCSASTSDGGGGDGNAPVFRAADPSKSCPAGYVGWDFATGGSGEGFEPGMKIEKVSCQSEHYPDVDEAKIKQFCEGTTACTVSQAGCYFGELTVEYRCGTDGPVLKQTQRTQGETSAITLACAMPSDADGGLRTVTAPTGKACVPRICPSTTIRDAKMQCVEVVKQRVEELRIGPPVVTALQRTSVNNLEDRLVADTEYEFIQSVTLMGGGLPQARIPLWVTDEFTAPGLPNVEGYRCTAINIPLDPVRTPQVQPNVFEARHRARVSPECTDARTGPSALADAARRAGMSLDDFSKTYTRKGMRIHASFDVEGRTITGAKMEDSYPPEMSCNTPNPPGFFYHPHPTDPSKSYVDMIGYYRQREAAYYEANPLTPLFNTDKKATSAGREFGTRAASKPTRIMMGTKFLTLGTPEVVVKKFGNATPAIDLDVGYYVAGGDEPNNPYSFRATSPKIKNLAQRNFRADVYVTRGDVAKQKSGMLIGSLPLPEGLPTGSSVRGTVNVSRAKLRPFFEEWKDVSTFRLYYCLAADGLDAGQGFSRGVNELPIVTNDGVQYGAGFGIDERSPPDSCVFSDTLLAVQRDETRSPFDPTARTANLENAGSSNSGNSETQGSQENGSEKTCSSTNGDKCTMARQSGMAASGMFGSTLFDATSTNQETTNSDGSGKASGGLEAEALGFNVIDLEDDGDDLSWADEADTPKTGLSFEIAPNWDAIVAVLKNGFTTSNLEFEKGRFSGRDGLGVAAGWKTYMQVGPIPGMVSIAVSAGVGVSLTFNVKFKPDNDYGCTNPDESGKCYTVITDKATMAEQRAACAKIGGQLAEARTALDWKAIKQVSNDANAGDYVWLGGQAAYRYVDAACSAPKDAAAQQACAAKALLYYRWLSDDKQFASAVGPGLPTVASDAALTSSDLSLVMKLPTDGGLAYAPSSGRAVLRDPAELRPAVCQLEPAKRERYIEYVGGLNVGAGAGLALSFCVPHDSFGVCIEGRVGFVDVSLGFMLGHQMRTLTLLDDSVMRVGGTYIDVPWSLNLLHGTLTAIFNFYLFSTSYTIVEWPGFQVASGSLFNYYTPVIERQP